VEEMIPRFRREDRPRIRRNRAAMPNRERLDEGFASPVSDSIALSSSINASKKVTLMAFYQWSTTAASNATADPTINWAEGQSPSSVNDSARAGNARLREWGNDISGQIATGGTSTAYTVTSNQVFDTLAHLNGQMIAFVPHATCGATVTLNVDGLGTKPLRFGPSLELQSGVLIQGTPYVASYNNADGAFYLQGRFANPYGVPLGGKRAQQRIRPAADEPSLVSTIREGLQPGGSLERAAIGMEGSLAILAVLRIGR
jgi:hypothetical protein